MLEISESVTENSGEEVKDKGNDTEAMTAGMEDTQE